MSTRQTGRGSGRRIRLLTVLDKMVVADLFKTTLAVLTVLVVIIVSRKFLKILTQAVEGSLSNATLLQMLAMKTVVAAATFLPAALFMAALMVLGRMYRDAEMAAVASAGGGAWTIYRSLAWFVLPLAVCAGLLSMLAAPWAEARIQQMTHADQQTADIRGISAGRFSEYSDGEVVFYAQDVEVDGLMRHVFIQDFDAGVHGVVSAESGRLQEQDGSLYLVVEHGERIQGEPGARDFSIESFDKYAVRIEKHARLLRLGREAMSNSALWYSSKLADIAEMQARIAIPTGVVFLGFLAVPLARLSPRGGVYGSLLTAFGIYFSYGNLQRVSHSWVVSGKIPVWMGYFWVDGLLLLLGVAILLNSYGWQWVAIQIKSRSGV